MSTYLNEKLTLLTFPFLLSDPPLMPVLLYLITTYSFYSIYYLISSWLQFTFSFIIWHFVISSCLLTERALLPLDSVVIIHEYLNILISFMYFVLFIIQTYISYSHTLVFYRWIVSVKKIIFKFRKYFCHFNNAGKYIINMTWLFTSLSVQRHYGEYARIP